jgi:DNA topoisomerase-6 subunit A
LLEKLESGAVQTKREFYYISKGKIKRDPKLKALDFAGQEESDSIIDFIGDMLEVYREELNCFANDRGGQTYSQQLVVTETLPDGSKAVVDLSTLGTTPFQPKNKPQHPPKQWPTAQVWAGYAWTSCALGFLTPPARPIS